MAVNFERRSSSAARWSRRVAAFSAVLLVTATFGHRLALIDTVPLFWLIGIVGTLALLALVLAASGFSRLWNHGDKGGRDSTRAVIVALVVLAPFLASGYRVIAYPALHDISTDTVDPPELIYAARARTGIMNRVEPITPEQAEAQMAAYPEVTGRRYDAPADRVMESIQTVLATRNWVRVSPMSESPADEPPSAETTIELTAWTFLFHFPSDVAIRLVDEGETSYVDMRSASRYGRHDLGDNASRIAAFLNELGTDVAGKVAVAPVTP